MLWQDQCISRLRYLPTRVNRSIYIFRIYILEMSDSTECIWRDWIELAMRDVSFVISDELNSFVNCKGHCVYCWLRGSIKSIKMLIIFYQNVKKRSIDVTLLYVTIKYKDMIYDTSFFTSLVQSEVCCFYNAIIINFQFNHN